MRKAPILLKDGDILGWTLTRQIEGDDFQTDEDLAWRIQVKNQPTKYKSKEQGGFKLNVDFWNKIVDVISSIVLVILN